MRKLHHQFLNLNETLPYDEDELQELNMFASGLEEGLQTLFNTESVREGVADSEKEAGTSTSTIKDTLVPSDSTSKDTSVPSPVVIQDSDCRSFIWGGWEFGVCRRGVSSGND